MTLIVPAGGSFAIGSNNETSTSNMNMSLDDVIASRRKETVAASRRGGRNRSSTSDRAVATGRAKRSAAMNARRNLTTTKKPTKMEIEKEVKTQSARTQRSKANVDKKKAGGRVAATGGRARRTATKAAKKVTETRGRQAKSQVVAGRPPSKKAVNAAVQAFKANGFQIPQGTQMVIRFEAPGQNTAKKPANNNNNARNNARAAGRARANNNNNNRNANNNRNTRSSSSSNNNNNNNSTRRSGGRRR